MPARVCAGNPHYMTRARLLLVLGHTFSAVPGQELLPYESAPVS